MRQVAIIIFIWLLGTVCGRASDYLYHGSFLWNDIRALVYQNGFLYGAFRDGVGAINLSRDFNKKKLYSSLEVNGFPTRLHAFDNTITVEIEDGTINLVDITDPADMQFLGSFSPPLEVYDLAILGEYLYLAVEYDGVMRFDISDPGNILFDDSSMSGIRVVNLAVYQSRLYALDDYNGVLIYEPDNIDMGEPVALLQLPSQGISIAIDNDSIFVGIKPTGYMVGTVEDVYSPRYLESRGSFIRADNIEIVQSGLALSNSINGFELVYHVADSMLDQLFPLEGIAGFPTTYTFNDKHYIAFPDRELGFIAYDIDDPELIDIRYPEYVYAYPGPITQLKFHNSRLHVIGTNNWYEIYDLSNPDEPVRTGKMINPPYQPAGMCSKGDTIFVADIETNSFFSAVDDGFGDPATILPIFSVMDSIGRPQITSNYYGAGEFIYYHNHERVNLSLRNGSQLIPNYVRWSFVDGVTAVEFCDNILYQANDIGVINTYTVDGNFQLQLSHESELSGLVNQIMKVDTLLYVALYGGLVTYSVANPAVPVYLATNFETIAVYEMQLVGPWLVCGTWSGIYVYDISAGIPELLFTGGEPALNVAYDNYTLAAGFGTSVKVYTAPVLAADDNLPQPAIDRLPRLSGFPNPFNPDINLIARNFTGFTEPIIIDVYDILGRRVRRLRASFSGNKSVEVIWDGRDENGNSAASGVYLFKAHNDNQQAFFKAVLLK